MAIKTYSAKKHGKKMLSAHFAVGEFASAYCDKILIDTELITLLEKVFAHFSCSKIIISSGYRPPVEDKAVGGSGSGYHVRGQAADFCAYDANGKKIDSSKVVLYLEDIGVNGIGYRCGGSPVYTHVDTRTEYKWYGDEANGKSCTSFYTYLGVKKTAEKKPAESKPTTSTPAKKNMNISDAGVELIKSYEGLSLKACKALPTEQYYTIGYGHYGSDVKPTDTITAEGAKQLLKKDLVFYVEHVNNALKVEVTQNQFDACVSLAYNIGVYGFAESDLVKYLNAGKFFKACAEFTLWRKSGGNIIAGLQNRRTKELRLFIKGNKVKLTAEMNVREKAGTSAKIVKTLAKGKSIKITDISINYTDAAIDIWGKYSGGWICLKQGATFYAK